MIINGLKKSQYFVVLITLSIFIFNFSIWFIYINSTKTSIFLKSLQQYYDYSKCESSKIDYIDNLKIRVKHNSKRQNEDLIKEYNRLDDSNVYTNSIIKKYISCYLDPDECQINEHAKKHLLEKGVKKIKNKLSFFKQLNKQKRAVDTNINSESTKLNDDLKFLLSSETSALESFEQILLYRDKSLQWLESLQNHHGFEYDSLKMDLISNTFNEKNLFSKQPYVANGYLGLKISNLGFGFAYDNDDTHGRVIANSWPLKNERYTGAFLTDFYCLLPKLPYTNFPEIDNDGWPSVISAIPYWNDFKVKFIDDEGLLHILSPNDPSLDKSQFTNFKQTLSMKTGIVSTSFDWLEKIRFNIEIIANKKIFSMASVVFDIEYIGKESPSKNMKLIIENKLDLNTGERIDLIKHGFDAEKKIMFMEVSPSNVPYSSAAIVESVYVNSCSDVNEEILASTKNMIKHKIFSKRFDENDYEVHYTKTPNAVISKYEFNDWGKNFKNCKNIRLIKLLSIHSSEFKSNSNLSVFDSSLGQIEKYSVTNRIPMEYHRLRILHINRWKDFHQKESFIEIPSDVLLEMVVRASLFHLFSNLREYNIDPNRGLPVPPSGLSSDSYGGMVFWDADLWVLPSLIPFSPNIAKSLIQYRNSSVADARQNCIKHGYEDNGMVCFPWTSARFANETSTGPAVDYEYHINIDIVYSFMTYYLAGNFKDPQEDREFLEYTLWPMMSDVCKFMSAYVQYNETKGLYETYNLTDPDEYANHINNGAYTNFAIKTLFGWAIDFSEHLNYTIPDRWEHIFSNMYIPINKNNITMEYDGMNSSIITKQADVLLNIFPLGPYNKNPDYQNTLNDLKFYTLRQATDGPAMSYQIYVAVTSSLLNHGCSSQSFLYKSVIPYLRLPFGQFSEQADDSNLKFPPAFPFLTANGAFIQSVIFGLTGIRFNYVMEDGNLNRVLEFNPKALKLLPGGISIRNFKYLGGTFDITISDYTASISYILGENPIMVKVPSFECLKCHSSDMHAGDTEQTYDSYTLIPQETLELELYHLDENIEGNVAECKLITSLNKGAPSEISLSANDGNNETHFQPYSMFETNIVIDIGPVDSTVLKGGTIIWGERPAKNFSIYALQKSKIVDIVEKTNKLSFINKYPHLSKRETDFKLNRLAVALAYGEIEADEFKKISLPLIKDQKVNISQPFERNIETGDGISIPPYNETSFTFDYKKFCQYDDLDFKKSPNPDNIKNIFNKEEFQHFSCGNYDDFETRFVMLSFEGVYDWDKEYEMPINVDDSEKFGATIREIALF
ncbi:uncharacterized protein HGUI_01240 [Hanseniaspora guilliermondii]|uniref:alpha,alpha-trehalase n=1 Tax=Hanseniaspora guilliermondii TaxID=56406 RepID=A0A1L0AY89_9ASCO|nr:uncharacterized protein HGUI_01240 [Hanseniaspora guilliermondii]